MNETWPLEPVLLRQVNLPHFLFYVKELWPPATGNHQWDDLSNPAARESATGQAFPVLAAWGSRKEFIKSIC